MTQKTLSYILSMIAIIGAGYYSYIKNTRTLYAEYSVLFEYRRLSPDFLPNTDTISISSAGHTTTYADTLWIQLVQYIGDNTGNGKYISFVNPLIETISELHPHFTSTYNLALVLSPFLNMERADYENNKVIAEKALEIGEKGMLANCDQEKILRILKEDFGNVLWENTALKNPCSDGMLPYNSAYVAQELGNTEKAKKYYKIATMNDDAPAASRFLGPLMEAKEGEHREVAEKFLLIAVEGYDESPFICQSLSLEILSELKNNTLASLISSLPEKEKLLTEPKDTDNPLSGSATACHASILRAMKQLYLAYITDITAPFPDVKNKDDILTKKLLKSIPSLKEQAGWDIVKDPSGIWRYQRPLS